jgi:GGDEF domain-containing protein
MTIPIPQSQVLPEFPQPLSAPGRRHDPVRLPVRHWCEGSREDAVTGLVAFPDFHSRLPRAIAEAFTDGRLVALAIGDVDGLKQHVEASNANSATDYGHLAGNRVMAQLGAITGRWFQDQPWEYACAATFGGDEVIIAAAVDNATQFDTAVQELRDQLVLALPVPVSFAWTAVSAAHTRPDPTGPRWRHTFTDLLLSTVDRTLFTHKAARRAANGPGGIVAVTELPENGYEARALLPLPSGPAVMHVSAQPTRIAGRRMLLLPCLGPAGLRGTRLRVRYPDTTRTVTAVTYAGRAAIPDPRQDDASNPVPLTVQAGRARTPHRMPDDLAAALTTAGLDWAVLPAHEQAQLLHLITESADTTVRTARINAACAAVTAHTPR